MDRAILEAQLAALEAQMLIYPPGSPQQVAVQSQIQTLQIELAEEPVVPPFFPHVFPHGPHGPVPHGPDHRR